MPVRWAAALIAFVTHTVNMVPRSSAPGHISAFTNFTSSISNFTKHTTHAFEIAGFLQKASHTSSNSSAPRQDYCIWLGATCNLAGTHNCFNIVILRMMTGDKFTPAPLTVDAAKRLTQLAGQKEGDLRQPEAPDLMNPSPPYSLNPNRGVADDVSTPSGNPIATNDPIFTHANATILFDETNVERLVITETAAGSSILVPTEDKVVTRLVQTREESAKNIDHDHSIYAAMSIKEATATYGKDPVALAGRTELLNCINKGVWEYLSTSYMPLRPIPSKLFLTPKHTAEGAFKLLKGRIVGEGHHQDVTQFQDSEISSPTVALTSVMIVASMAAHLGHRVMTLDHTAAYLNADMEGPVVEMMLSPEVSTMLCDIEPDSKRPIEESLVRLRAVGRFMV